jgi:hypothetical protein
VVPGKIFVVYAGYRAPIGVTNREFTAVRKLIGIVQHSLFFE